MNSGIYKITNTVNGKFYIGSTSDLKSRRRHHFNTLRYNTHHSSCLQNSFNKYGEEVFVFEVLEIVLREHLIEREQYYIDTLSPTFNMKKIVDGRPGSKITEETRIRMSLGQKRRVYSQETRNRMSAAKKGKIAHSKKVFLFTEKGIFVKKFSSMTECAKEFKVNISYISQLLKSGKLFKGFNLKLKQ